VKPRIWRGGDRLELRPPDMTAQDVHELATYNNEVNRGIVHTQEWKAKMAVLQERWNRWATREAESRGDIVLGSSPTDH
jgi:hypothetical protein